jgi:hypothetical protein
MDAMVASGVAALIALSITELSKRATSESACIPNERGFERLDFVSARLCESHRQMWSLSPVAIYNLKTARRRPGHDLALPCLAVP